MSTKKDPAPVPSGDNVDQIRELLFGTHIRAVDERFDAVEKRLAKESDALKKKLENRIVQLEKLVTQFREETGDQFTQEASEREAGLTDLNKSLEAFRFETKNLLAELQSDFSTETSQIRRELEAARMGLMGELGALQLAQTNRSDRLEADKVNRVELAKFLNYVAGKLKPPAKKSTK